jgi:hypothetical protein
MLGALLAGMGLVIASLAGCGKASEVASEKVVEKVIESQIAKEGGQAKVDLAEGQAKITSTDAQGRTTEAQFGGAKITEADLGVPIYPGAKLDDSAASIVDTPEGRMVSAQFNSGDAPDKVLAFYRDHLKAQSAGKQFVDMGAGDGTGSLMLGDDQSKASVQIAVAKSDDGSHIQIMATRGKNQP